MESFQVRLVARQVGVQQLERDTLVVTGVHGLVDDAPAALTDHTAEAVVGDSLRLRQLRRFIDHHKEFRTPVVDRRTPADRQPPLTPVGNAP
jgi:hypothetical protein